MLKNITGNFYIFSPLCISNIVLDELPINIIFEILFYIIDNNLHGVISMKWIPLLILVGFAIIISSFSKYLYNCKVLILEKCSFLIPWFNQFKQRWLGHCCKHWVHACSLRPSTCPPGLYNYVHVQVNCICSAMCSCNYLFPFWSGYWS